MTGQNTYTEPELVVALKQRDNKAFRHLYTYYRGALYSVITQIIPDTEVASDVLQEFFVTVWENIDKYDPAKGKLFTWLLNVARNKAINKTRSKNYKNSLKTEKLENFVHNNVGQHAVSQNINQIGLKNELGKLKTELKQIIELSYFEGFTQNEISQILDIPLGTVKTRMRSGLTELRKQFSK